MSTEIATIPDVTGRYADITITRYWGGHEKGICYRLTQRTEETFGHVSFSAREWKIIAGILKTDQDCIMGVMCDTCGKEIREKYFHREGKNICLQCNKGENQ